MTKEQWIKILKVMIIATALMFLFDGLFEIPQVTNWVGSLVTGTQGWLVYLVIWLIMFIQVCLIPIPALVILNASIEIGVQMSLRTWGGWLYILVVLSAYMAGAVIAYLMGRKWGRKAVKWCAGDDKEYDKWSGFLTTKGKWPYAITILLPIFPDDLLCLVAGSVKFDFGFFFIANLVGRAVGLICMIGSLTLAKSLLNQGSIPWSTIIWAIALLGEIVALLILNIKLKKERIQKIKNKEI